MYVAPTKSVCKLNCDCSGRCCCCAFLCGLLCGLICGSFAYVVACYKVVSQLVCSAVHPVAVKAKVCDILGLSACAVIYDNACCACGNLNDELCLVKFVLGCLYVVCSGPLA